MLRLPPFRFHRPRTVREAVAIRADTGPDGAFVAGGTDLYPNMKRRQQVPRHVISLSAIPALTRLRFSSDGAAIGAAVPLSRLEHDGRILRGYPALARAISTISTPPLRNMGTLGGNVLLDTRCNYYDQSFEWRQAIDFCMKKDGAICWVAPASPRCLAVASADSVPVLIALGARARLTGPDGERDVAVEELYQDDGIRYLTTRPGELLTEILIPRPDGWRASYRKLRRRGSFDFPVLGVGAAVRRDGDLVLEARIVATGVASTPVRLRAAEDRLCGSRLAPGDVAEAAHLSAMAARPMDNTDFSFLWRKEVAGRFVAAALSDLAAQSPATPGEDTARGA
jgi:4-hydroxybenzoyl-CoA reductase subunit beta